jgi:hypothetical protein
MALRVLGLNPDGSCAFFTIGKTPIHFLSFSYGDNVKAEWVKQAGTMIPVADTPGEYETEEGALKVTRVVWSAEIAPLLPKWGAANARRVAIVNFVHPEIGQDSDALTGFRILGAKQSIEAGSKGLEVELKVRYRIVQWTEKRICFGNPRGGGIEGTARI